MQNGLYKIISRKNDETEVWEFTTGEIVKCEERIQNNKTYLVATERVYIPVDFTFSTDYDVQFVDETKTNYPVYYFTANRMEESVFELRLLFIPHNSAPWIGYFACSKDDATDFSKLFSSLNPDKVFVICKGRGYLVSVIEPENYEILPSLIIKGNMSISMELMVFACFDKVVAYDENGLKWVSGQILNKGLKKLEVCTDFVCLTDEAGETMLDAETGKDYFNL